MPKSRIARAVSAALLCLMLLVQVIGCGKRVATSSGDAAGTTKSASAAAPVETIKPDALATLPEEKTSTSTIETAREPLETPTPTPSGQNREPSVPPAAFSAPAAPSGGLSPGGERLSLTDIFFDFDQYTIRTDARSTLSKDADWINSTPSKAIVIEGHCDERGTQAYNLVLGDKRARSVKRYLEDLGVPASRLKTTSYGELRPFCKERDESCYQQNRRAHFVVH
ncbi:MAG TPA: peptidoglycan-associated lipoprotein Pal [Nitrospira sp.]|jgi:peptidoglycan-associated lipoprotein|nr:peptidoglycan-associated lipoprotein Pal [Nitrospira sp.]